MLDPNNQIIKIKTTAQSGRIEIRTKIKAFVKNTTQGGNVVPYTDWCTQNEEFTMGLIAEERMLLSRLNIHVQSTVQ